METKTGQRDKRHSSRKPDTLLPRQDRTDSTGREWKGEWEGRGKEGEEERDGRGEAEAAAG